MTPSHIMSFALFFTISLIVTEVASAKEWWDPAWQYRQRINIQSAAIQEDLIDFPLGLRLTDKNFARTLAQDMGRDLRAVDEQGHVLPYEIVSWQPDAVELYILIPRIFANQPGQYVDLYYGNHQADAPTDPTIWPDEYHLVLHLAGDTEDATGKPLPVSREGFVVQNGWTAGLIMADSHPWITLESKHRGFLDVLPAILKGLGPDLTFTFRFRTRGQDRQTLCSGSGPTKSDWFDFGIDLPRMILQTGDLQEPETSSLTVEGAAIGSWQSASISYQADSSIRVICIDGKTLSRDHISTGALKLNQLRIGRGTRATEKSQFHGDIDEVRIWNGARSVVWMKAETLNLSQANPLVQMGPLQGYKKTLPPPAPPELMLPLNNVQSHKPNGVQLEWRPSVGAQSYTVHLFKDKAAKQLLNSLDAGPNTTLTLTPDLAPGLTTFWTVVAKSEHGQTQAQELRQLTFYQWGKQPTEKITEKKKPSLTVPRDMRIELDGYLGKRINSIADYLLVMPDRNPGMLRILRERPQQVIPWSGIYAGQYLCSAQLIWRLTRHQALKEKIDTFARDLIACQRQDGYLGPFNDLRGYVSLWNHYAQLSGLLLYYEDTGFKPALEAAEKIGDLLIETYGPQGHTVVKAGGANESISHAVAMLFRLTKKSRFLDLANYFMHEVWNEKGGVRYLKNGLQRKSVNEFPVRRWESVYNIMTFSEMYWLTSNDDYRRACEHLWQTLVQTERHNTGGFSTNEGLLGTPYNPGTIETCCTVAWIMLSVDMLKLTGDSRVTDEIEWSTLNSALASMPYDGSCSLYACQADGTREYCALQQGPPEGDGPELNCCSTNANRALGMISLWALMQNANGLALNFYGPSTLSAQLSSGNRVTLKQTTRYPAEPNIQINVSPRQPEQFTLDLRIPRWSKNTSVTVNGKPVQKPIAGTYLSIKRKWQAGDTVELELDFSLRFWAGEQECAGKISVYRGPILYACDARFNPQGLNALPKLNWKDAKIEPQPWQGQTAPWALAKLTDGNGNSFTVCDFASAGLTGTSYRSWLAALNLPPSPFHLKQPYNHETGKLLTWEKQAGATSWTLLVSQSRDFSTAQRIEKLKQIQTPVPALPAGEYYWTVIAQNRHGCTEAANAPFHLVVK